MSDDGNFCNHKDRNTRANSEAVKESAHFGSLCLKYSASQQDPWKIPLKLSAMASKIGMNVQVPSAYKFNVYKG